MSFLFFFLLLFLLVPLTIVLNIIVRLFGFFRQTKRTFDNFGSGGTSASQTETGSSRQQRQKEKIITKDEGEYVDFEEVK